MGRNARETEFYFSEADMIKDPNAHAISWSYEDEPLFRHLIYKTSDSKHMFRTIEYLLPLDKCGIVPEEMVPVYFVGKETCQDKIDKSSKSFDAIFSRIIAGPGARAEGYYDKKIGIDPSVIAEVMDELEKIMGIQSPLIPKPAADDYISEPPPDTEEYVCAADPSADVYVSGDFN